MMASFNTKNTLAVNKAEEASMIFFDIISELKIVSTNIVLMYNVIQ